jgi:hypothetical protein
LYIIPLILSRLRTYETNHIDKGMHQEAENSGGRSSTQEAAINDRRTVFPAPASCSCHLI